MGIYDNFKSNRNYINEKRAEAQILRLCPL